ncbi:M56 family metallopeptidase [Arenibacter troitsensis]|uniref:TonB family C-terminal domain-containing protein n=1 Tax=Arenibacter troitsensis TaxID=188872 RepID=A0A1X7HXH6_9FLAO|nr:M56 family metallopeptidase [Arenibacter troitsensis]SMG06139.1 TonB family C-terminal domain-containing protein [Arenibacter troitsensis]
MIRYILECMAFQLLFLIVYDLFLKRETFFQWNRAYLIGTFVLSLLLPWIKIEAFKTTVSSEYFIYPEYLWGMDMSEGMVVAPENSPSFDLSAIEIIFYGGMVIAALLFAYKLFQINRLKRHGEIRYFKDFTRVLVRNSNIAFSFFRSIFLGDQVLQKEHQSIIQHELVHIEQRHTWDLLFFELVRIIGWFNPLVYVYQNRVSELHEFIADAKVAKTHKAEQYQLLLSQVFQTQHISFINQFFKTSLVKKRIVMLQKSKSKKVWQLKYLLLLPLVVGMLLYTSLEAQENGISEEEQATSAEQLIKKTKLPQLGNPNQDDVDVPFSQVEKVPIFPGCEDTENMRDCFQKQIQKHIGKNFNYPEEAMEKGIQGRVNVMFVIQKDGSIGNVRMRAPDKILEAEAARIISLLPKMVPGEHKGKKVRVPYSIPITFKLQRQDEFGISKNDDGTVDVAFAIIDKVPVFPGCEDVGDVRACFNQMLQRHIGTNFRYPEQAQEMGIQGRVNVLFIIQKDGSIGNVRLRGPDKLLEDEAARIISLLPQMTPGEHRGEKVRVPFSIPITFKLEGPKDNGTSQSPELTSVSNTMSVMAIVKKVGGKEYLRCMVTDGTKGLPGVNVSVRGKNEVAVTDFDGIIEIEAHTGDVLTFQYKGLPTTMLVVTEQQKYHITNK